MAWSLSARADAVYHLQRLQAKLGRACVLVDPCNRNREQIDADIDAKQAWLDESNAKRNASMLVRLEKQLADVKAEMNNHGPFTHEYVVLQNKAMALAGQLGRARARVMCDQARKEFN